MAKKKFTLEIYKDGDGKFRSRALARNGRITFDSGEGYNTKQALVKTTDSFLQALRDGNYDINDTTVNGQS